MVDNKYHEKEMYNLQNKGYKGLKECENNSLTVVES